MSRSQRSRIAKHRKPEPVFGFACLFRSSGVLMTMRKCKLAILAIAVLVQVNTGAAYLFAQNSQSPQAESITRQETLRGSITPKREWWDVLHYHLQVEFLPETRRLRKSNTIIFKTLKPGNKMQIDLQPPLAITKVTHGDSQLKFEREGNVYWVMFEKEIPKGIEDRIEIFYEGVPVVSKNPPWVGGITWGRDDLGEPLIVTTCEGIGASIWWPNKDHGADEPDRGMQISVTVPENLVAVSNGRLKKTDHDVAAKKKTFHWEVVNPINNYGVNVNIGNYVNLSTGRRGRASAHIRLSRSPRGFCSKAPRASIAHPLPQVFLHALPIEHPTRDARAGPRLVGLLSPTPTKLCCGGRN
jgi:hypothetical protein